MIGRAFHEQLHTAVVIGMLIEEKFAEPAPLWRQNGIPHSAAFGSKGYVVAYQALQKGSAVLACEGEDRAVWEKASHA
ncbi:hypothetical protein AA106555_1134 [Neokomagataea thailandica NBRC 106555]|uniref:Uncharacterized protein n=1 Tax=Neokomagataea thailandica NBRC 106555 TaxID=1223520 RepID=A0ABQ0QQ33_9PROT|nr:hypothetical protein AA106555_1134 [Neokomagataea thailandica NBRC 106555]